jgi:hypothetical protein
MRLPNLDGGRPQYSFQILAEEFHAGASVESRFGKELVPLARLERARPQGQQILSLPRLPVPPQGQRERRRS